MNKEEVKKILVSIQNHLEKYEERFKDGAIDSTTYYLYCDDARTLLDYITNLQKEKGMYKSSFETMSKNYFEEKSRIDRAIKYIEKHKEPLHHSFDEPDCDYWIATNPDDLLDILRGEDNEGN